MPSTLTYEEACKQATTDQGLDPVVDFLSRGDFPVTVDQTGGFCMCAAVYTRDRTAWVWISTEWEDDENGERVYLLGYYRDDSEGMELDDGGGVDYAAFPLGAEMTRWILDHMEMTR